MMVEQAASYSSLNMPAVKKEPDEIFLHEVPHLSIVKQEPDDETTDASESASVPIAENSDEPEDLNIKTEFTLPDCLPVIADVSSCASQTTKDKAENSETASQLPKIQPSSDEQFLSTLPQNELSVFGEFVASQLREIPDPCVQLFARNYISLFLNKVKLMGKNILPIAHLLESSLFPDSMKSSKRYMPQNANSISSPFNSPNLKTYIPQNATSSSSTFNSPNLKTHVPQNATSSSSPFNSPNLKTYSKLKRKLPKLCIRPTPSPSFHQNSADPASNSSASNIIILSSANPASTSVVSSNSIQCVTTPHVPSAIFSNSNKSSVYTCVTSTISSNPNQSSSTTHILPNAASSSSNQTSVNTPIISGSSVFNQRSPVPYFLSTVPNNINQGVSSPYILPDASTNFRQRPANPYIVAPNINAANVPVITLITPNMPGMTYVNNRLPFR